MQDGEELERPPRGRSAFRASDTWSGLRGVALAALLTMTAPACLGPWGDRSAANDASTSSTGEGGRATPHGDDRPADDLDREDGGTQPSDATSRDAGTQTVGADGVTDAMGSDSDDGIDAGGVTDGDGSSGPSGGGSSGSTGGGPSPDAVLFREDFEATSDDAVPSGFQSFVGYVVDSNNTKQGNAYALVDATKPHAGSKSLHVKGGGSPAMLTKPLPQGTNAVYVRTWVFLTGSLGHAPGRNHETLLGLRKSHGGANDEVRFGEIKGVIGINEVPSDNISPKMDQWGKGPEISAGAWHCIEVAFLGDRASHEVRAWSDGTEIFAVTDPSQWQNGPLSPTFLDGKFVELILGWHSFSGYENELWFDDLVVAKERVGCE